MAEGGGNVKPKLVYVLPVYDANSVEHTFHMHSFLTQVAKYMDVLVVVERTLGSIDLQGVAVYQRRVQLPILKHLETLAAMLWARLHGYRCFYTHYSTSAGILSAIVTRLFGGVSYYWSCGQMMLFVPKRIGSLSDLRDMMRNRWLLGLTLHSVHCLVTCNATMARYYSEHYSLAPSRIRVIPNWVKLERFADLPTRAALRVELGWPHDKKIVLFLHRLSERKGAHLIVPIVQQLLQNNAGAASQWLIVIVGGGPYKQQLESDIRQAALSDLVKVVGPVPNREVPKYYAAADVYMMPSVEEAFGRTLLEAMASGCPITAMDVGGVRDVLSPTQQRFLVPGNDTAAMAASLETLLREDALRQELVAAGHEHVKKFAEGVVVRSFVSLTGHAGADAPPQGVETGCT